MVQSSTAVPSQTIPLSPQQIQALLPLFPTLAQFADLLIGFACGPICPQNTAAFEQQLAELTRLLGLFAIVNCLNSLEPADPQQLPKEIHHEGTCFRRRTKPTTWTISCVFGQFKLRHFYYEPRQSGEACLHPLMEVLGIVSFSTPGLCSKAARLHADHSQKVTLQILAQEHQVYWSEDFLRKVVGRVSFVLGEQQLAVLAGRIVEYLEQASRSCGSHLPVLAAGRDGVTMPMAIKGYKEGSVATVTVYDRRSQRLGTVYLAYMPEADQPTMSKQLTDLLSEVLRRWSSRKLHLAYVTDAGWHPQQYYQEVLKNMEDPLNPGKKLAWEWVVDYYHASKYVTQLAQGLFGEGQQAQAWAARMRRLLKEGNGVTRVLQAAGYQASQKGYRLADQEKYDTGWNYLHNYARWMQYQRNKRVGIPLGSGVTEAGCKVIVTQRLKRSGMRWKLAGGQVVLNLRTLHVSGLWQQAWDSYMLLHTSELNHTYAAYLDALPQNAA
jgi:hypothetical protein